MTAVDLLLTNITQLVTCANGLQPKRGDQMQDVGLIEDGAVAIKDGRIVAAGKTADITGQYTGDQVMDCAGKIVCPGFVDPHTHTVYAGNRMAEFESRIQGKSYMEIMAAGGGIASTMRATRAASLDELVESARARLDTMMQLGTTTVEIKSGYGLDTATEIKMLGAIALLDQQHPTTIVPTFLGAHAMPPERSDAAEYTEYVLDEMLPAAAEWYRGSHFAAQGMPLFVDVFCEQGVFDLAMSRRILKAGKTAGMLVKSHVDEFVNLRGVSMSVELDAVSVDHLDVTPDDELEHLAQSDTVGVMLPAVNFNLGSTHFGDARKLIDSGGALALATDLNPGSAPTPSMPMIMAIACRYQKLLPSEALNASTINAAAAIRLTDQLGSLEAGKQADLLVLDVPDYRAVAYEFGANPVETVIIKGEVVWNR